MGGIYSKNDERTNTTAVKRKTNDEVNKPVPKRFRSTFDYLYETLYIKGENSDITINALNKQWNLHKIYICQSPFFASMFNGSWSEKNKKEITLNFSDDNITVESLNIIFGSFYYDELSLTNENVVSVLATSVWFHLSEICNVCQKFIGNNLIFENVVQYYDLATIYGLSHLKEKCLDILCCTVIIADDSQSYFSILRSISSSLMLKIISNPRLFVIQVEEDVLLLLFKWLYLKKFPEVSLYGEVLMKTIRNYFRQKNITATDFCESSSVLNELFSQIRWDSIIGTLNTTISVMKFPIIPSENLNNAFQTQWMTMLYTEENNNSCSNGSCTVQLPKIEDFSESDIFWKFSERCGRILFTNNNAIWRWAGYRFGVDIVIRYLSRTREFFIFSFRSQHNDNGFIKLRYSGDQTMGVPTSKVSIHATIAQFNPKLYDTKLEELYGSPATSTTSQKLQYFPRFIFPFIHSGVLNLDLVDNEPIKIFSLPDDWNFPIVFTNNILRYNPATKFLINHK